MPDLPILAYPAIVLAAAVLGVALTRNYHANRYGNRIAELEHGLTIVRADRDQLLTVVGNLVDAIHYRPDQLDKVAHQAREAIDGRWTQ